MFELCLVPCELMPDKCVAVQVISSPVRVPFPMTGPF
jgi:hypothetical protein